jgi:hypothetical protein
VHKRTSYFLISCLLITLLLLSITGPVLAEEDTTFRHWIDYNIDGRINIYREIGDFCNTGAVKIQTVNGYGEMTKSEDVRIAPHIMSIQETTDWTTATDAIRNLTVITTIDLCARPKSAAASTYEIEDGVEIQIGDIINPYHPLVVDGTIAVRGLTSQRWATLISPDRGESGSYYADFIAAYGPGPYEEKFGEMDELGEISFYDEKYLWWFDADKADGIDRGDYYVGNYFDIDQYAATTGGEFRRFISMSSPFSHAYLTEDLVVFGRAEVRDVFSMDNITAGPKAITLAWWELF